MGATKVSVSGVDEYTLRLRGVRFQGHVGASREERAVPQEIVVDVDLSLPVLSLPKRDRLKEIVSYDTIASSVVEEGQVEAYRLLETYVTRVVARLLDETGAFRIRVAATKKRVPTRYPVASASVELVGTRRPSG